jgi:hypothetical protein
MATDPKAAAIHRARAEADYEAADKFRRLGLVRSEAEALDLARREDEIAAMLETGREPRRARRSA